MKPNRDIPYRKAIIFLPESPDRIDDSLMLGLSLYKIVEIDYRYEVYNQI